MNDASAQQLTAIAKFRALHESGCFALPNPWDVGTAVFLQHLRVRSSRHHISRFAFSRGLPDTVTAVSRDDMLAHIQQVVEATPLPVNADFQKGYADNA